MPTAVKLESVNAQQIRLAGPRYTPGADPSAPNLAIASLDLLIGSVAFEDSLEAHVSSLAEGVKKARENASHQFERLFRRRRVTTEHVEAELRAIRGAGPTRVGAKLSALSRIVRQVRRTVGDARKSLRVRLRAVVDDNAKRGLESELYYLQRLDEALGRVVAWRDDPSFAALTNNRLLILGEWGTGKTHFLCDHVRRRTDLGLPTLFLLAHQLTPGVEPLAAICTQTRVAATPAKLLARLEKLGRKAKGRALLVIDGINEGDRAVWKRYLRELAGTTTRFPHVGFVLSCRRPFQSEIFARRVASQWIQVEHPGFSDIEFDAQLEYFRYFKIPAPETPLLTPEFTRPLFLKIVCETIRSLGTNAQRDYIRDLASGQKGMTKLMEDFAWHIGGPIEVEFGLANGTCWRLLKGHRASKQSALVGIAPILAEGIREYATRDECVEAIRCITGWSERQRCRQLLQRLCADGILSEDVRWRGNDDYDPVVRLPYQRFSDHIIARYLMEKYLAGKNNEVTIRRAFFAGRPLGKVFELGPGGHQFKMPGWASAIMLEFPERVKRSLLPATDRELVTYLPRDRRRAHALKDVFLDGLAWRSRDSFFPATAKLLNVFLKHDAHNGRDQAFDVLVGLAIKRDHPWSSQKLYAYLAGMDMPQRDSRWTEFLGGCDERSVVIRVIEWIERTGASHLRADSAVAYLKMLAMVLTTTRRTLRDRATRAIVEIGERHPSALFTTTIESLSFNDPYVPERMLAASYGVAMRRWADPDGREVRLALPAFARRLLDEMFMPGALHATTHALIRDSAAGIIALAQRVAPKCIPTRKRRFVRAPFHHIPSSFPAVASIDTVATESVASALRMDFENYSIGSLIPGRRNYDANHVDYAGVRRQILWRIANLGYSAELFGEADRWTERFSVTSTGADREKIDRYGKKYSWIAYFEMYGVRSDAGTLPDWKEPRPADIDLDPSFPIGAKVWRPPLPNLFIGAPQDHRAWVAEGPVPDYNTKLLYRTSADGERGPWVLINGFIYEYAPADARRVFTFLRGLLVDDRNAAKLVKKFGAERYPGNDALPEVVKDHYTFAGEVPWSPRFGSSERDKRGRAKPAIRHAFHHFVRSRWTGINVEVPVWSSEWESYHSELNRVSGGYAPAPALCETLGLVNHAGTWDLFDAQGRRATMCRVFRGPGQYFSSHLLYIRASLLRRYLASSRRKLVWFSWGERELEHDALLALRAQQPSQSPRDAHIHKRFKIWDS